jgi:hypothetical protein
MEREDLLRDRLVLREHQAVSPGARVVLADQLHETGDLEVRGVVVGKGLGQVEHEIAFHARQRQQALRRPVELVHRALVTLLGEDFADLLFDFLLVQCPDDR